jgi:Ca-activated chloride channel homolog
MSFDQAIDYLRQVQCAEPHWLWALLLLPLLALLRGARGGQTALTFSSLHLLRRIARPGASTWGWWSMAFPLVTLALGIGALARPQHLRTQEITPSSGVEIMVVIDVSLSMAIEDFTVDGSTVNRLTVAKKVTRDFIRQRTNDRLGLVAFAGRPYVPGTLTLDHEWLLSTLSEQVKIGRVEDGTAIGSAIGAAAKRLDSREAKSKVMLLLTDGSNNSGNLTPLDAATLAKALGVKIYTIAVGTEGFHRIPIPDRLGRMLPGVRQEFDLGLLKKIADLTGGMFFRAQDTNSLQRIFSTIDQMEKTEVKKQKLTHRQELFHYLLTAALIVALIGLVLRHLVFRENPAV